MFIECSYQECALRQEGHVCLRGEYARFVTDMALLTEGGLALRLIYNHGPPDGGRTRIMAY